MKYFYFFSRVFISGMDNVLHVNGLPQWIKENEADELFEDLRKAGARIKWIDASTNKQASVLARLSIVLDQCGQPRTKFSVELQI